MEFDKSKILTVITADKLNEGQMGWINDYVEYLKSDIKSISPYKVFRTNKTNIEFPFEAEHRGVRRYFYPAPEPTYAERQAQWVKENNLKVGSTVKVVSIEHSPAKRNPSGKNRLIGTTNKIIEITDEHICIDWDMLPNKGCWVMSYLDLEPAKPEPVYRPFANAEEFKPYRDEWFRAKHNGGILRICAYNYKGVQEANGKFNTYQIFFEEAERENGEPCGVKEEA